MRLLYVCSDFGISPTGTKGASIHLRAITGALAELGHEVILLSPKGGAGAEHPTRPLLNEESRPVEKTAKVLKRWLVDHGFDDAAARELRPLLYNTWAPSKALERLADRQSRLAGPPDAIIERLSLFGYVGVELADALNVPLILEVNAPLADEARKHRALRCVELASQFEQRVLARSDAIVAVSQPLADRLAASGVAREKIHAVPNGVDVSLFDAAPPREVCRDELGLSDAFVIGFAGSLKPWHGVDLLIGAFARFMAEAPSSRLLIVGTGPAEDALKKSAADAGIAEAVVFTGAVPHERIPIMLKAMDVGVAPFCRSDDFYFSPIKLFEYMMAGSCVVASRLGQIVDVIEEGTHGLLFEPDQVDDLYRVLRQAYASGDLRARLGNAAQELVRSQYTWLHAAGKTVKIVEEALECRNQEKGETSKRSTANH